MREALRLIAAQLCHFPESLDTAEIHKIIENIQRRHLFQANTVNYLRIKDVFRAFTDLVALNQLIARAERKCWSTEGNRSQAQNQVSFESR